MLLFLDIGLPTIDQGWQVLTELRVHYPRLPIIVLSSHQEPEIIAKAYELGANSFMYKPMQLEDWEHSFQIVSDYWFSTVTLPVGGFS